MLRHLDLFSGIGGFSLAAQWVYGNAHEPIAFCEIGKYCQKVLKKHWPDVPIFEDIRSLDGRQFKDIDLISGGFPCQPFSYAGKRKGKEDDRHLWPEMLRIIQQARPRWIVGENVPGIINMELDTVLSDLEDEDYACQTLIIPACAVDARHRRERVWILAHAQGCDDRRGSRQVQSENEQQEGKRQEERAAEFGCSGESLSNTLLYGSHCQKRDETQQGGNGKDNGLFVGNCEWKPEPELGRVADGIPDRVDRLKVLGNAIVPQVAYELLKMIKAIDEQEKAREIKKMQLKLW